MPGAARIIEKEIEYRKASRTALQDKLDLEEIERRIAAVKDGRSKILTKEEADVLFEKIRPNG